MGFGCLLANLADRINHMPCAECYIIHGLTRHDPNEPGIYLTDGNWFNRDE